MGTSPPAVERALKDLRHPDPETRRKAISTLKRLRSKDGYPLDKVLKALRARRGLSARRERDQGMRRLLWDTTQVVAVARARRLGTKVPPPSKSLAGDRELSRYATQLLWEAVDIYRDRETLRSVLDLATPGQIGAFAAQWCESEVCNGGFHQFFHNSTGILAPEALAGFRQLGANGLATPLFDAMALFPGGPPDDCGARQEALDLIPYESFRPLDDAFYAALARDGALDTLVARYVRLHPAEFFSD